MKKGKDRILLAHGSGGSYTHSFIIDELLPRFSNSILECLEDQASFMLDGTRMAVTTDSYVVSPLFFPGGNIGELAVYGTINDLAVGGYEPLFLTMALIIEEGFPMDDLSRILDSAAAAAREAGVSIVSGDTKVVNRGSADGLFINTAGIGRMPVGADYRLSASGIEVGDLVLLSGTIGDHGMAVMSSREGLKLESPISSDTAPLHGLSKIIMKNASSVHAMRDPTRGGLATTLVEMAHASKVIIDIWEGELPVREEVRGACEILGLDPLYVANEGKLVAFVSPDSAGAILDGVRGHALGKDARIIGEVTGKSDGRVILSTTIGGSRVLTMPSGEQLPRIC